MFQKRIGEAITKLIIAPIYNQGLRSQFRLPKQANKITAIHKKTPWTLQRMQRPAMIPK